MCDTDFTTWRQNDSIRTWSPAWKIILKATGYSREEVQHFKHCSCATCIKLSSYFNDNEIWESVYLEIHYRVLVVLELWRGRPMLIQLVIQLLHYFPTWLISENFNMVGKSEALIGMQSPHYTNFLWPIFRKFY